MSDDTTEGSSSAETLDFIRAIVKDDQTTNKHEGRIATRFPPEPNGYLHIGHAKSICLNFGIAEEYGGTCNLRFDDTNPIKEDVEYVESIQEDVRWLGFDWADRLYYASDYFERIYEAAVRLIREGKAYVDSLDAEQIREYRGTLTEPGRNSPYRDRTVEENLDLFERMRAGEFEDGEHVLRAKIDMASGNINLRDPTLYRIRKVAHHRTGDAWSIYPMYDFTHALSDAFEHITHSLCTLEFEDHRPLYDWSVDETTVPFKPRQIEFARLNLSYTVLSKRKLLRLVEEDAHVSGLGRPPHADAERPADAAAIRPSPFERSATASASRNATASWTSLSSSTRYARTSTGPGTALHGCPPPVTRRARELPGGPGSRSSTPSTTPRTRARAPAKSLSRGCSTSSGTIFMEDPPKKFFRLAPGREVTSPLRLPYYVYRRR